jgi:hypothetical protein
MIALSTLQWAYIYAALTGSSFKESGKKTWDLFKSRGACAGATQRA